MIPFDKDGLFQPCEKDQGLRSIAVRSAGVTVIAQGVLFVVQLASTMILARLLTPEDFGVVTMVTTFSLLLMSFGQNGFNEAILQRDDIDHKLASNIFWILIGAGLLLGAVFLGCGSLLARFYHDARVTLVVMAVSVAVFLGNTSVVHLALLKRAMQFTATSINEIVARALSVIVSISLAVAGWGYWALVAGAITQPLATSAGAWMLCRWIPGRPHRSGATGSVLRFVTNVYGRYCFNYFARNLDNLLVGWRFGSASLGFYKKAYDLFVLPVNQLLYPASDVGLCTLSRLQHDSVQYKRYFLRGLSLLAFIGMGVGATLTLIGKDVIRLLLGPAWGEAGHVFTAFAPAVGIMMIYNSTGLLHLSIGRPDRWFKWVLVEFTVTGLMFLGALHFGPVGIAAAWTASFWILLLPAFWYAGKPIEFGVKPVIAAIWKFVVAGMIAGYASGLIASQIPGFSRGSTSLATAAIHVLEISISVLLIYLLAVICLHGGLSPIRDFAKLLPDALPWAKYKTRRGVPAGSEVTVSV